MAYQWNDSDCERIAEEAMEVEGEGAIHPETTNERSIIMIERLACLVYDLAKHMDTVMLATKLACKE